MGIDGTASSGHRRDVPSAAGDQRAEQMDGRPAGRQDARDHPPAEPRSREEYADAVRAGVPGLRPDSPPGDSEGHEVRDRTGTEGEPAAGRARERPPDHAKDHHHRALVPDDPDRPGIAGAEPRTREEYAAAARGNSAVVTHFHGEFRGRPLDLYTDGARWAAADTPRPGETTAGKGGLPDRLPSGEELLDGDGEGMSLTERLRRELYEESDDEIDVLEKGTSLVHDVFSRPPTGSYTGTSPDQPHIYAAPHSGIDAGSAATAVFTLGLVIDRAARWAMRHHDQHAKER